MTGEIQTAQKATPKPKPIQVNIQLINANTESLGWGSTFTKPKDEFLDMQNEIATKLASELKGSSIGLGVALLAHRETQQLAQKATENPEAQREYQAGRREWNKRSKEGFENAIKHFEKAIELDPNYSPIRFKYVKRLGGYLWPIAIYNFAAPIDAMPKAKA